MRNVKMAENFIPIVYCNIKMKRKKIRSVSTHGIRVNETNDDDAIGRDEW